MKYDRNSGEQTHLSFDDFSVDSNVTNDVANNMMFYVLFGKSSFTE